MNFSCQRPLHLASCRRSCAVWLTVCLVSAAGIGWSAEPNVPEADAAAKTQRSPFYDLVYYTNDGGDTRTIKVRPYPQWLAPPLPKNVDYKFELFTKGAGRSVYRLTSEQLQRIDYFELRLLRQAAKRLQASTDALVRPVAAVDVARAGGESDAVAAERLLMSAIDGHNSAEQQNLRRGPEWDEYVLRPLEAALLNVRLGRIDELIAHGNDAQARQLCDRAAAGLLGHPEQLRAALLGRYERLLVAPAERAADERNYGLARKLLDEFASVFRSSDSDDRAAKLAGRLRADAAALLKQAEALPADQQRRALELIDAAAKAAPELPGIDDLRRRLKTAYPTLHCAYAELPNTWLPQSARLAVERHAAALLFDRLVRPVAGAAGYEPQLAVEHPVALAKGRSFELPHLPPAKWSDYSEREPHLVTAADVAWTIRLLGRDAAPGFSPAWSQAIAGAEPAGAIDPFTVELRLSRDHWDPLSFMHFAILPKHRFPQGGAKQEWEAFDEQPVGGGPYRLAERDAQAARFVANPHYREAARPAIREITFQLVPPEEAVLELYEKRVQMVADLPSALIQQVTERGGRVATLHPSSVWFLAPNFRRPAMKNQDLRLALAHAIDRRAVLDSVFRSPGHTGDHAELSGPFPAASWAYDSDVAPFDLRQAGPLVDEAKRKLGNLPQLDLVYRTSEPGAEQACRQIAAQAKEAGIELRLVGVGPQQFFARILDVQDFDLAYWRHDFTDRTFWLGGLFDPDPRAKARGGANFLGYTPDASVNEFFRDLALHKRFVDLRRTMHKLHAHVARRAIVIPLWQLDTYVALDDSLAEVELDPLTLFGDVTSWRLKTGEREEQ